MKPTAIALAFATMAVACAGPEPRATLAVPYAPQQYEFGSAAEMQRAIRLTLEHTHEPEEHFKAALH